jgi:hypothetical protein
MDGIDTYLRGLEAAASSNLLERPDRDTRGWRDTLVSGLELGMRLRARPTRWSQVETSSSSCT